MTDQSVKQISKTQALATCALVLAFLMGAGCASNTIDQAVPAASDGTAAPRNSGQYPNINIVPEGETAQLSDAETAQTRATLEGEAAAQRRNGESAEAYVARLRKLQALGSTHAADTLRQIENGQ
jgi:hypothetical protein